ncbi:lipid II:glycine glycyltransferase FemX [Methanosphaerula subterraneus]|uniref:lipid II:glycine glycyltransferase FemX n=1 Tax=Methanosphaerula subterraneus TaxID=3350244 RepID=UPI003F82D8FB
MVEIVANVNDNEWNRFLLTQSDATIYHTPEWRTFLEKTFSYKPHYLFATDESGQLTGLLPLFLVKSRITGNRLSAVPFSHQCGCLGDDTAYNALIDEAFALTKKCHTEILEIKDLINSHNFQGRNEFCTHMLELSQNPEMIWKNVHRNARRNVKKSKEIGIQVESSSNHDDVKDFYEINAITKHKLGVPCHPLRFYINLFSTLSAYVRLFISRLDGEMIGAGIMEYYKDQVIFGYSAANPEYLQLRPYYAFIWASIEDACLAGYRTYDFGRTSYDNSGLIQFKRKWGTLERELYYSYYPSSSQSIVTDRSTSLYRLENSIIRTMPMSAYKVFSNSVFSSFG